MDHRKFGSTNRDVPVVGQGTWYIEHGDTAKSVAAMQRGIDLGMTHIDTAEMYGSGKAEQLVAKVIAGRRDDVFIVSKVLPGNASRAGTIAACERSLTRLQTSHIDTYLLHWRGSYPLEDTIAAFEQLQKDGKILSWGVSNFDVSDLEELAALTGKSLPTCNQVLYHLQERAIEHAVAPWCEQHGVAVVAYSPFGHGHSGFPAARTQGGRVLQQIGDAHNLTPRQVALEFLLQLPNAFVIPKASNPAHVEENAGAGDLVLSQDEVAQIDEAFPRGSKPHGLPTI